MKKIVLKKTVVANLDSDTMNSLKGGEVPNTFGENTCFRPDPPFSVICQFTHACGGGPELWPPHRPTQPTAEPCIVPATDPRDCLIQVTAEAGCLVPWP